jgi:hypothetical protein
VSPNVRFEDEADVEYREAGRWYEERRIGLGLDFFDAVDATIRQILDFPRLGMYVTVCRKTPSQATRRETVPVPHFLNDAVQL